MTHMLDAEESPPTDKAVVVEMLLLCQAAAIDQLNGGEDVHIYQLKMMKNTAIW